MNVEKKLAKLKEMFTQENWKNYCGELFEDSIGALCGNPIFSSLLAFTILVWLLTEAKSKLDLLSLIKVSISPRLQ